MEDALLIFFLLVYWIIRRFIPHQPHVIIRRYAKRHKKHHLKETSGQPPLASVLTCNRDPKRPGRLYDCIFNSKKAKGEIKRRLVTPIPWDKLRARFPSPLIPPHVQRGAERPLVPSAPIRGSPTKSRFGAAVFRGSASLYGENKRCPRYLPFEPKLPSQRPKVPMQNDSIGEKAQDGITGYNKSINERAQDGITGYNKSTSEKAQYCVTGFKSINERAQDGITGYNKAIDEIAQDGISGYKSINERAQDGITGYKSINERAQDCITDYNNSIIERARDCIKRHNDSIIERAKDYIRRYNDSIGEGAQNCSRRFNDYIIERAKDRIIRYNYSISEMAQACVIPYDDSMCEIAEDCIRRYDSISDREQDCIRITRCCPSSAKTTCPP